jgi:hypothetical protein
MTGAAHRKLGVSLRFTHERAHPCHRNKKAHLANLASWALLFMAERQGLRLHVLVRAASQPARAVQNRSYDFVEPFNTPGLSSLSQK